MILFSLCFLYVMPTFVSSKDDIHQECASKMNVLRSEFKSCVKDAETEATTYSIFSSYEVVGVRETNDEFASFKKKSICSQNYDKINCLKNAHENIVVCFSQFQINQLNNKLSGLKAKTDFECLSDEKERLVLQEIQKRSIKITKCDIEFKTNDQMFLLNFNFEIPIGDAQLWSKNDCKKKRKWIKCIFNVHSDYKNKTIAIVLKKYYNSIYNSYSLCNNINRNNLLPTSASHDLAHIEKRGGFFREQPTTKNSNDKQCTCPTVNPCKASNFKIGDWIFDYVKYYLIYYLIT